MSRTIRNNSYFNYCPRVESYVTRQGRYYPTLGPIDVSWYLKIGRDGKYTDGNADRNYRVHTNQIIRRANRANAKRIIQDPDRADEIIHATKKDGKFLGWLYW